ncbi:MAG: s-methyl-5-thioribose-1-phosphate isomerase [Peptoniphilus sp.]|nr:s-methyl-5-thioribose-1-phosphate isomerase [Peptoniphilus sp.]MDY3118035.1 s-methyl-5-thioribose-1-phosphate isomerase [Peptoniphilus sp.]
MEFDRDLAYMLQAEHVAYYKDGVVSILDRRIYPIRTDYVRCKSHVEVRDALRAMVTQSAGPYTAAAMGMALAAYESRHLKGEERFCYLTKAAEVLANARPTTSGRMRQVTQGALAVARKHLNDEDLDLILRDHALKSMKQRYETIDKAAKHFMALLPDVGTVMTQCFGETIIGMLGREIRKSGKAIAFVCPETRPFLQGARFTASVLSQMGLDTTVITDNMVTSYIENNGITLFTSAADSICMDGSIVNKVGTHQIAILCDHFHIPYYATGIPDMDIQNARDLTIEMRDPEESLSAHGIKHTVEGVHGYYPAFDVTPPHLVTGVVTDLGIFASEKLQDYQERKGAGDFYFAV